MFFEFRTRFVQGERKQRLPRFAEGISGPDNPAQVPGQSAHFLFGGVGDFYSRMQSGKSGADD